MIHRRCPPLRRRRARLRSRGPPTSACSATGRLNLAILDTWAGTVPVIPAGDACLQFAGSFVRKQGHDHQEDDQRRQSDWIRATDDSEIRMTTTAEIARATR